MDYESLFLENEAEINKQSIEIIKIFGVICVFGCIFAICVDEKRYLCLNILICFFYMAVFTLMYVINKTVSEKSKIYKYLVLTWFFIPVVVESVITADYFWIAYVIPIVLSCRYYNVKLVYIVSVIAQFSLLIASFGVAYIQPYFGYVRASSIILREGINLYGDGRWLNEITAEMIREGIVSKHDYWKALYFDYLIYYAMLLAGISFCCSIITKHEINVIKKYVDILEEKHRTEIDLAESRYQVMVSQIHPHFVFNVLGSIYALCDIDTDKAKKMIKAFSGYLRHNIDTLQTEYYVPFRIELEAITNYLEIEKMRFGEELSVEMDIQEENFLILPLSVQPLVENAVKHGIREKNGSGTIRVVTHAENDNIIITITDDGAGFDPEAINNDGKSHIGISSTIRRLKHKMGAEVTIISEIDKGTVVKICIPQQNTREEIV